MKLGAVEIDMEKLFYGAITVGERGQVVIPAEARKELGIGPGDKLLVFQHPCGASLILTKTEALRTMMNEWVGKWSALQELLQEEAKEDER